MRLRSPKEKIASSVCDLARNDSFERAEPQGEIAEPQRKDCFVSFGKLRAQDELKLLSRFLLPHTRET